MTWKRTYICFNSGGNDSLAVLQFMVLNELPKTARVISLYTNTGWSAEYWPERMERIALWCEERGIEHVELATKGFERLVLDGDAGTIHFPNGMRKTCTERLKILPAKYWMGNKDPEGEAICVLGVRRVESKRRANTPIFEPCSINHGGRALWKPLAEYTEEQRDELVTGAGFEVLPHRSDECEVCIHANRADVKRFTPRGVARVRALEQATGKFMFRPKGYAGAEGIDEVIRWANSERGKYRPPGETADPDLFAQLLGEASPAADDGEEKLNDCEDDFCGL